MKLNPMGLLVMFIAAALGMIALRGAMSSHSAAAAPAAETAAPRPKPTPTVDPAIQGRTAYLRKEDNGHFWTDARINGAPIHLMVDSGASVVALTRQDALRLHIDPSRLLYDRQMSTANGHARAASVILDEIVIDRVRVEHVQAVVMDGGLDVSLLGMSFLNRLTSWEAKPRAMLIRQ